MIHNMPTTLPAKVILLEQSGFEFFLTGSRFFGTARPDSDWDFFTQDTREVREWLKQHGFNFYSSKAMYAGDGQCNQVAVWGERDGDDDFQPEDQIHVQLVSSVKVKSFVQKTLLERYPSGTFTTDHTTARLIWSTAFQFFELGRSSL